MTLRSHFAPIRSLKMLSSCFPWFYTRLLFCRFGERFVPDVTLVVPAHSLDEVHQWCSRAPALCLYPRHSAVLRTCNLGHVVGNFAPPEGKGSLMGGEGVRGQMYLCKQWRLSEKQYCLWWPYLSSTTGGWC